MCSTAGVPCLHTSDVSYILSDLGSIWLLWGSLCTARTTAMGSPLRLFGVVCKDEHLAILNQGIIPLRYGHRWAYWGLRTSPADAVERARLFD